MAGRAGKACQLLFRDDKVDGGLVFLAHADLLSPSFGLGEDGSWHSLLTENIDHAFAPQDVPALMPSHDFIIPGRDVGQFVFAVFIAHRVVRMRNHEDFRVHPYMPAVTLEVDEA